MQTRHIAAAFIALSMGTMAQAAPLVTNGDFSATTFTSNSQFGTGYGGQGVTGWQGNGGYNLYFTGPGAAVATSANSQYSGNGERLWADTASPTGGAFVALDGDSNVQGGISQTITGLVKGQSYALTFSWAAGQLQSRTGATTEQLQASLGGQSFTTPVVSNPSQGFTGWFTNTFTYTATATSELLSFLSMGTPTGLPPIAALDGVSLTAVPEPATIALLGLPLLGASLFWRRRQQ